MADVQIVRSAVSAVPGVYVLPDAADFTLKAVNASLDGSGAASSFLPCVTILSDSGHVIARAVDQAVSVAAGGTAEVSWFPGVKNSSAAGADMFAPWQYVSVFNLDSMGSWSQNMTTAPTVDALCLNNGYLKSDGT